MSHHCGLVFENILQRDEGIWKCKMDLTDKYSKTHSFKKVIDLKVHKRNRRGDTHFGYSGGNANVEFGSGDGSGDNEPSFDKSNRLRTRRRKRNKRNKRKRHGGKEFSFFGGFEPDYDGSGSGYGSGLEPDYDDLFSRGEGIYHYERGLLSIWTNSVLHSRSANKVAPMSSS